MGDGERMGRRAPGGPDDRPAGRSLDCPDPGDGVEVRAGAAHASRREALVEIVRLTRELRRCDPSGGVVPVEDLREWARLVEEVAEEALRPQPAPPPE